MKNQQQKTQVAWEKQLFANEKNEGTEKKKRNKGEENDKVRFRYCRAKKYHYNIMLS